MTFSRRVSRRRLKPLPGTPMHSMITFPVRQNWFALPIQLAQKVVPLAHPKDRQGLGLMQIEGQQVPLLDLTPYIYRDSPQAALPGSAQEGGGLSLPPQVDDQHVLILRLPQTDGVLGLVISQTPVLRRVPQTAFGPIPAAFLSLSQMRCINAVISLSEREAPIFLLDLAQIVPPFPPLPAA